jgi:hypothetical protein
MDHPGEIIMSPQPEFAAATPEQLARLEEHIQSRLTGRVHDLRLVLHEGGLVLRGHAHTYYAKQLAQHAVMDAMSLPIRANEIDVS